MTGSYMFDTNMMSAMVHQRRGFERVANRIDALQIEQRLISAITMSELHTMIAKAVDPPGRLGGVRLVLAHFNIVDFGEAAALHAGQIRAHLETRGQSIGPLDTLIAAHARSLGAAVVTDDMREFSRVPDLVVENWLR